jgi:hypothetical protein
VADAPWGFLKPTPRDDDDDCSKTWGEVSCGQCEAEVNRYWVGVRPSDWSYIVSVACIWVTFNEYVIGYFNFCHENVLSIWASFGKNSISVSIAEIDVLELIVFYLYLVNNFNDVVVHDVFWVLNLHISKLFIIFFIKQF